MTTPLLPEPQSMEELARLTNERTHISGMGTETRTELPCPWCAAPEFLTLYVADPRLPKSQIRCRSCRRVLQLVETVEGPVKHVEFVKVGGPPQPEWFTPKMREAEPNDVG